MAKVSVQQCDKCAVPDVDTLASVEEKLSLTTSNTGNPPSAPPNTHRRRYACNPRSRREQGDADQRRREVRINGVPQLQSFVDAIIENSDE